MPGVRGLSASQVRVRRGTKRPRRGGAASAAWASERPTSQCRAFYAIADLQPPDRAPDAHAKNYSVLLLGDDVRLAPLYDVASGLPYLATQQGGLRSAAMAISWEREFGRVERKHWTGFAAQTRQDAEQVMDALRSLAGSLPDAMSDALSDPLITRAAGALRSRLLDKVAHLCAVTTGELDRSARHQNLP